MRPRWGQRIPVYVVLLFGTALMVLPLLWMVSTSLASTKYVTTFPPKLFPDTFEFANYGRIFSDTDLGRYLFNSVVIVIPSMVGQVVASSFAGYALARLRAPGRRIWFVVTLATLMIPYEATIVPTFVTFQYLGWINTFWPLIVPQLFGSGYSIFLMRQFIMQIPTEYDEAARLDGLGYFGIWRRIIVPLSVPALATVAIFTFTFQWGNFLGPLIYINDPEKYPLALGLYAMTQTSNVGQTPDWNLIMAGGMLLTVPMVMVYFFGQRFLYEGGNALGRIRV
ncbi:carbohydrate ABC transporter permease [Asanoa iriomotensis]|uniref:Sugar ABC transporter permease n=1 Tax=Asanoa iriomotensis TaxID=234613 RepID=A0ABQ4BU84_9ACTN|nr:carbohydrate ABC transporter permease [Asanoa iriomotensis]GIF54089.1 sugar ABC transporter permease [Asanoa iriomotensis]